MEVLEAVVNVPDPTLVVVLTVVEVVDVCTEGGGDWRTSRFSTVGSCITSQNPSSSSLSPSMSCSSINSAASSESGCIS